MSLVKARCTSCGGELDVDPQKECWVCQYCNTPFIVEKAINNYNTYINNNTVNNITADTVIINGPNISSLIQEGQDICKELISKCGFDLYTEYKNVLPEERKRLSEITKKILENEYTNFYGHYFNIVNNTYKDTDFEYCFKSPNECILLADYYISYFKESLILLFTDRVLRYINILGERYAQVSSYFENNPGKASERFKQGMEEIRESISSRLSITAVGERYCSNLGSPDADLSLPDLDYMYDFLSFLGEKSLREFIPCAEKIRDCVIIGCVEAGCGISKNEYTYRYVILCKLLGFDYNEDEALNYINNLVAKGIAEDKAEKERLQEEENKRKLEAKRKIRRRRIIKAAACLVVLALAAVGITFFIKTCFTEPAGCSFSNGTLYIGEDCDEEIIIPDRIHYEPVTAVSCNGKNTKLKSITLTSDFITINDNAFKGCTSLKEVNMPGIITSIGSNAFEGCISLTSFTIPNSVTSIKDEAFKGCTGLISFTLPDSITSIGTGLFENCTSLNSINLSSSLSGIEDSMFKGCTSLTGLSLPESVTYIGNNAFAGCTSWSQNALTGTVTSIGDNAFEGCTSLTSFIISESILKLGNYVFKDCTGLTNVSLPSTISSIDMNMFEGCTSLTYNTYSNAMYLGNDIHPYVVLVKVTDKAVSTCNIISTCRIICSYAFEGCPELTSIIIPDSVVEIGEGIFKDCTGLTSVTLPFVGKNSVDSVEFSYFFGVKNNSKISSNLTTVILGNSCTVIGDYAFDECINLQNVTIPSSVKSIGTEAFDNCHEIVSEITLLGVTTIGDKAFENCKGITSVKFGQNLVSIGEYAFHYCTSLKSISLPEGLSELGESAFEKCTALTQITIPSSIENVSAGLCYYCTELTTIVISDGVKSIGASAFESCYAVSSLYIGNTVESIEKSAFNACRGLTSVTIPVSVTSIGYDAFSYCSKLKTIHYSGTKAEWYSITFAKEWISSDYTVQCSDGDAVQ